MDFISRLLSAYLPVLIVLTAVLTYFSPYYIVTYTWVPGLLLGIVIYFTGLSMDSRSLREMRWKKREITIAALLKWSLTAGISMILAYSFFAGEPQIAAGIILSGTVPSATAAALYTFLAGGSTSLVVVSSLLDTAISPVAVIIAMFGIEGSQVSISFWNLLQSFLLIVVIPILLGLLTQRMFSGAAVYSKPLTRLGSSLSLLLIVHLITGEGSDAFRDHLSIMPLLTVVVFIQVTAPMALGYAAAKKLRLSEADARAVLFHVGLCNTALAAILAFEFIGDIGAVPPIINMIFNLSIGSAVSNRFKYIS